MIRPATPCDLACTPVRSGLQPYVFQGVCSVLPTLTLSLTLSLTLTLTLSLTLTLTLSLTLTLPLTLSLTLTPTLTRARAQRCSPSSVTCA